MTHHKKITDIQNKDNYSDLEMAIIYKLMAIEDPTRYSYEFTINFEGIEYFIDATFDKNDSDWMLDDKGDYHIVIDGVYNINIICKEDDDLNSEFELYMEKNLDLKIQLENTTYWA